ncbi:unnamed protein product [Parascedosporium putredinis]|uniref:Ribosome maturation protein SDO1/SBDS N-terminal domain-containing protein n=1 Tax=Parascedosporium putredinis TaxID=1442378 RepID=A0A9P1H5B5_9PEZI|nr:unnamed protein product [Parascedosporium putredinis]CAI7997658.1 unnamed protein product [Parascedosporium putredinis]
MARGEATKIRVHLKGAHQDFIVFVDDNETFQNFKIFGTGGQGGAQGSYNAPSRADLENEFDTHDEDTIIQRILGSGEAQEIEMPERQGNTNDSFNSTKTRT